MEKIMIFVLTTVIGAIVSALLNESVKKSLERVFPHITNKQIIAVIFIILCSGGALLGYRYVKDQNEKKIQLLQQESERYRQRTDSINAVSRRLQNRNKTELNTFLGDKNSENTNHPPAPANPPKQNVKNDPVVCPTCNGTGYTMDFQPCTYCLGQGHQICAYCKGKGETPCGYCRGAGSNPCKTCNGLGKTNCATCKGAGSTVCATCKGLGKTPQIIKGVTVPVPCLTCMGKGNLTCKTCNGKGGITCNQCKGAGNLNCTFCSGKGSLTCKQCDGTGKNKQICFYCNGTGTSKVRTKVTCVTCNGTGKIYN